MTVNKDKLRALLDKLSEDELISLRAMINGRLSKGKPRPNATKAVKNRTKKVLTSKTQE